jgi:sirohydrochlorin cobaltochelatase
VSVEAVVSAAPENAEVSDGRALVLFAHGARDAQWAEPFAKIAGLLRERNPDTPVVLAFLELMQPSLDEAIGKLVAQGRQRITLVPLFLARGGHLKNDLPALIGTIETRYPDLTIHVTEAIGEVESILRHIANWVDDQFLNDK